ncbi:MAG TPA: CPBP family intramembrane glutamic endopeptidase, partial [Bacteroidales bacterium]|nr:CPBP family intramembrane glutamic endopeptidase [Bacteroidales bacterium]
GRLTYSIIGISAGLLATVVFLRFDRKRFSDIGLRFERKTLVNFFIGVMAGVIVMGALATSVLLFTHKTISINANSNVFHFIWVTLPLIPLAFMEELGFRAYPLETLKDKVGIRPTIFITSLLFGSYHIVNGWTIASSLYGPAIWGLLFGLAAVYSRGIAMPTGVHYACNLTTSAFGDPGSNVSIWTVAQANSSPATHDGVDWVTILPAFAVLVLGIVCIEIYMRRKPQII